MRVVLGREADVRLDGKVVSDALDFEEGENESPRSEMGLGMGPTSKKRKRTDEGNDIWVVKRGLWRLRVQAINGNGGANGKGKVECVMVAVKLDAISGERGRNVARDWLDD